MLKSIRIVTSKELILAIERQDVDAIDASLNHSGDGEIWDKQVLSKALVKAAINTHNKVICSKLIDKGAEFAHGSLQYGFDNNIKALQDYINQHMNYKNSMISYLFHSKLHADFQGNTALHYAAAAGAVDAISLLIKENVSEMDQTNNKSETSFLIACKNGHLQLVKLLIDEGVDNKRANLNKVDLKGKNGLLHAAEHDHLEVVKFLYEEKKMDINIKIYKQKSCKNIFDIAYEKKCYKVILYLENTDFEFNEEQRKILNFIKLEANNATLSLSENKISNSNKLKSSSSSEGNEINELHVMAASKSFKKGSFDSAVKKTTNRYARNSEDETSLFSAIRHGNVEFLKAYLKQFPEDLNYKTHEGIGVLEYTLQHKQKNLLLEILKLDVKDFIFFDDNFSLFHHVYTYNPKLLLMILQDLNKYPYLKTGLNFKFKNKAILASILENPQEENFELLLQNLLQHNVMLINLNDLNQNAFHIAANAECSEKYLNILGKNNREYERLLMFKDKNGYMPIHYAAINGHINSFKWFLTQGNKPFDAAGSQVGKVTVLHLAIKHFRENIIDYVLLDKRNRSHFWFSDNNQITPLQLIRGMAKNNKSLQIMKSKIKDACRIFFVNRLADCICHTISSCGNKDIKKADFLKKDRLQALFELILQTKGDYRNIVEFMLYQLDNNQLNCEINSFSEHIVNQLNIQLDKRSNKNRYEQCCEEIKIKGSYVHIKKLMDNIIIAYQKIKDDQEIKKAIEQTKKTSKVMSKAEELILLKKEAFTISLKEALNYLFYMHLAIVKYDVDPKQSSMFSNTKSLMNIALPIIQNNISNIQVGQYNINNGLIVSLAHAFVDVFGSLQAEKSRKKALLIVNALKDNNNSEWINSNAVDAIIELYYQRFRDQIQFMSVSYSSNLNICGYKKALTIHPTNGIVQFANVIAKRIGIHIMLKMDIHKKNVSLSNRFSNYVKNMFRDVQDKIYFAHRHLLVRCLRASWHQEIDAEVEIQCDIKDKHGQTVCWMAHDILCRTGFRDITHDNLFYRRPDHFVPEIGYCYAHAEEIQERGGVLTAPDFNINSLLTDNNAETVTHLNYKIHSSKHSKSTFFGGKNPFHILSDLIQASTTSNYLDEDTYKLLVKIVFDNKDKKVTFLQIFEMVGLKKYSVKHENDTSVYFSAKIYNVILRDPNAYNILVMKDENKSVMQQLKQ